MGKFRGNQLVALLENFSMYEDMLEKFANSANSAIEENEKRLNSWQSKVNQFTNAVAQMWNNAISTELVKIFIDSGTSIVTVIDKIISTFGVLTPIIFAISLAFLTLSTKGKELNATFLWLTGGATQYTIALNALNASLKSGQISINTYMAGITALNTKYQIAKLGALAFSGSLNFIKVNAIQAGLALMKAFPPLLLITGVTYGIQKLASYLIEQKEATRQLEVEQKKLTETYITQKDKINELLSKYKELSGIKEKSTSQEQEYLSTQNQLASLIPTLVTHTDAQGQAILRKGDALQREIDKLNELEEIENKRIIRDHNKDILTQQRKIDAIQREIESIEALADTQLHYYGGFDQLTQDEKIIKLKYELIDARDELIAITDKYNKVISDSADKLKETVEYSYDLNEIQKSISTSLNDYISKVESLHTAYTQLNNGQKLTAKQMFDLIENHEELVSALKVEDGQLTINKKAIENLLKVKEKDFKFTIDSQIEKVRIHQESLNQLLGGYIAEAEGINTLNEAHKALLITMRQRFEEGIALELFFGTGTFNKDEISKRFDQFIKGEVGDVQKSINNLTKLKNELNLDKLFAKDEKTTSTPDPKQPKDISQYVSSQFSKSMDEVNSKITDSKYLLSTYNEESEEYRNELQNQITLQGKLQSLYHEEANRLRDRNAEILKNTDYLNHLNLSQEEFNNLTDEQKERYNKLKKELDDNEKAIYGLGTSYMSAEEAIDGFNQSIENSNIKEVFTNLSNNLKPLNSELKLLEHQFKLIPTDDFASKQKNLSEQSNVLNKILEQQISDLESLKDEKYDNIRGTAEFVKQQDDLTWSIRGVTEALNVQTTALKANLESLADSTISLIKKSYTDLRDLGIKIHREDIKNLNEKLAKIKEVYDAQLQTIDREEKTEDFESDLANLQSDRLNIEKRLGLARRDNSIEGKARVLEIEQELADNTVAIEKLQLSRTRDLRRQNLTDRMTIIESGINAQIEGIEEEIKLEEDKYDELINNDAEYLRLKNEMLAGNFDEVRQLLEQFQIDFEVFNNEITNGIGGSWQSVINIIGELKGKIVELNSATGEGTVKFGKFDEATRNVLKSLQDLKTKFAEEGNAQGVAYVEELVQGIINGSTTTGLFLMPDLLLKAFDLKAQFEVQGNEQGSNYIQGLIDNIVEKKDGAQQEAEAVLTLFDLKAQYEAEGNIQGSAYAQGLIDKLISGKTDIETELNSIAALVALQNLKNKYANAGKTSAELYVNSIAEGIRNGTTKVNKELEYLIENMDELLELRNAIELVYVAPSSSTGGSGGSGSGGSGSGGSGSGGSGGSNLVYDPEMGQYYNPSTGEWVTMHKGGIVGEEDNQQSKLMNTLLNTDANEQAIIALKNEVLSPQQNWMKFAVPNLHKLMSSIVPQVALGGAGGGGNTIYNYDFHIGSVTGDKKGAEYLISETIKGLKMKGKV